MIGDSPQGGTRAPATRRPCVAYTGHVAGHAASRAGRDLHPAKNGGVTMDAQEPRDPGARRGRRDAPRHRGLTALRLVTIAACLAFALMLATAPPREAPRVGAIGSGCSYELDTWTGRLTIRPTDGVSGEMARVYSALPGDDLRHAVRSVSVERGVLAPRTPATSSGAWTQWRPSTSPGSTPRGPRT